MGRAVLLIINDETQDKAINVKNKYDSKKMSNFFLLFADDYKIHNHYTSLM